MPSSRIAQPIVCAPPFITLLPSRIDQLESDSSSGKENHVHLNTDEVAIDEASGDYALSDEASASPAADSAATNEANSSRIEENHIELPPLTATPSPLAHSIPVYAISPPHRLTPQTASPIPVSPTPSSSPLSPCGDTLECQPVLLNLPDDAIQETVESHGPPGENGYIEQNSQDYVEAGNENIDHPETNGFDSPDSGDIEIPQLVPVDLTVQYQEERSASASDDLTMPDITTCQFTRRSFHDEEFSEGSMDVDDSREVHSVASGDHNYISVKSSSSVSGSGTPDITAELLNNHCDDSNVSKSSATESVPRARPNKRKCSEKAAELIKACMGVEDKRGSFSVNLSAAKNVI